MQKLSFTRAAIVTTLLLGVAGCNTTGTKDAAQNTAAAEDNRITSEELRAYCPAVSLREGTAYFSKYAKGGEKTSDHLMYQATITDTTRACKYGSGTMTMEIAAAGRIVPGAKFNSGNTTMPIRVAVVQGDKVVYSKLHQQPVSLNAKTASQFVLNDNQVTFPMPDKQNVQVFVGFDEGPYNTK
ncbi:hypothetical protein ACI0FM_05105 [Paenochrobactrum sp. BZR 588]|uniref:hypothetical protein n=1 Tax=Paenochrobactrum TaxID=999488 RepID=UPI0035BBEBD0